MFSTQPQYQTRTFQPPAIHAPQPIHTNISDTLERQTQHMNERQPITPASKPVSPKNTPTRVETSMHDSPSPMQAQTFVSKPPQKHYTSKSVADLRGLAKGAIMSLLQKGIQYDALVKEGVNDKVLRELYADLNLPVGEAPASEAVSAEMEISTDKAIFASRSERYTTCGTGQRRANHLRKQCKCSFGHHYSATSCSISHKLCHSDKSCISQSRTQRPDRTTSCGESRPAQSFAECIRVRCI